MKKTIRQIFLIFLLLILVLLAGGFAFAWHKYGHLITESKEKANAIAATSSYDDFTMAGKTKIYDKDGDLITELSSETKYRKDLTYDELTDNTKNAFIAIEDRTFWKNPGYDLKGLLRVGLNYITSRGGEMHGASTITQQLAKNIYLSSEVSITRKLTEIFLSAKLTKMYTKEEILTAYINNVYFANNFYGIEAAAQGYFGCSASELSLAQTAYLAAIPNRPAYYDPWTNPENAMERRYKILEDMYDCGYITEDELQEALSEDIELNPKPEQASAEESYNATDDAFSSYAINCTIKYMMEEDGFEFCYSWDSTDDYNSYMEQYKDEYEYIKGQLYAKNYTVYTSLDSSIQKEMQNVIDEKLAEHNTEVGDDGIYLMQGAMTVVDNSTGRVVAIVGGRSQTEASGGLNRAYQSYRQPGSSIKPLVVYAPALGLGYDSSSMLQNIDVKAANKEGADVDSLTGPEMSLRSAVEKSVNGCAYWLYNQIKPSVGLSYIQEMKFDKIVPADETLASGLGGLTYGVTTTQMASAYATIAYDGIYRGATCITDILDQTGESVYHDPEEEQIYNKEAANKMTDIMEGVITEGTGTAARFDYTITMAGKTGTTNDNKDAWFCGFAPATGYKTGQGYTVAVWVGYDTPTSDSVLQGGDFPAKIWKAAMQRLIPNTSDFEKDKDYGYEDDYGYDYNQYYDDSSYYDYSWDSGTTDQSTSTTTNQTTTDQTTTNQSTTDQSSSQTTTDQSGSQTTTEPAAPDSGTTDQSLPDSGGGEAGY